jgi:hypothetical protein
MVQKRNVSMGSYCQTGHSPVSDYLLNYMLVRGRGGLNPCYINCGRPQVVATPQLEESVLDVIDENPTISLIGESRGWYE